MSPRSCAAAAVLALVIAGCAGKGAVLPDPAFRTERAASWIAVVGAPRQSELADPTRQAGRLVASELSLHWLNVLDRDMLIEAHPELASAFSRAAQQIVIGEQVDPAIVDALLRGHGVGQILVVNVFRHEQVWGRETRITRVGMEARLVKLADGKILWQGRTDPEISGALGSGFDVATRQAAQEMVRLLTGRRRSLDETPMATWPVLEYFTSN